MSTEIVRLVTPIPERALWGDPAPRLKVRIVFPKVRRPTIATGLSLWCPIQQTLVITGAHMLSELKAHTAIAVVDLERAKAFYRDKLGFEPYAEDLTGLRYRAGGETEFLLYSTPSAGTAKNSVMGFVTDDIRRDVTQLKSRGVIFEEYDYPTLKTVDGIAQTPGDSLSAWFKDSEGNTLGIAQFPKQV